MTQLGPRRPLVLAKVVQKRHELNGRLILQISRAIAMETGAVETGRH